MEKNKPNHVAIIMDGNGRWATKQKKKRVFGHQKGSDVIKDVINFALKDNVKYLTLFAFSTENWNRPKAEVNFLLKLLAKKIDKKSTADFFNENNIKFKWLGFEDNKIPLKLVQQFFKLEELTNNNSKLNLTIAFNYGGVQDIENSYKNNNDLSIHENMASHFLPNVDLLIRTGNEKRISNFLLYESAYAEIIFEPTMWPDYNEKVWNQNISDYINRDRRYGKV